MADLTEPKPHDEAEELLPWYATGRLDERDRTRVEAHLSDCSQCRQQLSVERRLIEEFRAMTPEVESAWARLRARIDAPVPVRPRRPSPFVEAWALLSRPAVAGFAAAQLAFVIVAGGVLLSLSKPAYHALGSASPPAAANVIVMFRADATEEEVRDVLKATGATIVGGPTAADAYLLHVAPQHRPAALAKLQSNDNVSMAEPVDGGSP